MTISAEIDRDSREFFVVLNDIEKILDNYTSKDLT
jgi:hypothetical protein